MERGHLKIKRKAGQTIIIGDTEVRIVRTSQGSADLLISASKDVPIRRGELAAISIEESEDEEVSVPFGRG